MHNKKDLILPTVVLTVICLVASAALAYTNQITAPLIEAAQEKAATAARLQVLPSADSFSPVEGVSMENVIDVYEADNGAGYAITAAAKGYGGQLQVMVGIGSDGKIAETQVLVSNETPGLGSRVSLDKYRSQYIGKSPKLEGVDVISGSTVSSKAFETAVKTAYQAYAEVTGTEIGLDDVNDPREMMFPGKAMTPIELKGAKEAYLVPGEGYLIVIETYGYHNTPMDVLTAIDHEGKIIRTALGANSETPGIGTQVGLDSHTEQFIGLDDSTIKNVDIVTGATTSSGAFHSGVEQALSMVTPEMLAELEADDQ